MDDLGTYDIQFLSILAGDETTYTGGWGAWMTACGEHCKRYGYARGLYDITPKGLEVLEHLANSDS